MKKRNSKTLAVLLISIILVGIGFSVALYLLCSSISNISKSHQAIITPYHFSENYPDKKPPSPEYPIKLEKLPSNFSQLDKISEYEIDIQNITEVLNYGKTVVKVGNEADYNSLINSMIENKNPILIDNQLLSLTFLSQLELIKEDFIKQEIIEYAPIYKKKLEKNLFIKTLYPFHRGKINNLIDAFSSCIGIDECVRAYSDINVEELTFLRLMGYEEYADKIEILKLLKKDTLSTGFIPLLPNILNTNDIEVINQWDSDSFELSSNNDQSLNYGDECEIRANVNSELLDRMIEFISFLTIEVETRNYEIEELNNLKENLLTLRQISLGEEGKSRDVLIDILSSQVFDIKYSNILLTTFHENDKEIIYSTPILKYSRIIPTVNNENIEEDYDIKPLPLVSGKVRIPILMYHQIATTDNLNIKRLFVSPQTFEKQIAYLVRKNYRIIDTSELYSILQSGEQPKQKTVMLTFDDSTKSHYDAAYPILRKYHVTGVFFVIASRSLLSSSQLKEMSDNGMDIQSHSNTHLDFSKATHDMISKEASLSKSILEGITKKEVDAIAYPGCLARNNDLGIMSNNGYKLGFSCGRFIDISMKNRLYISRVHVDDDMESFIKTLSVGL